MSQKQAPHAEENITMVAVFRRVSLVTGKVFVLALALYSLFFIVIPTVFPQTSKEAETSPEVIPIVILLGFFALNVVFVLFLRHLFYWKKKQSFWPLYSFCSIGIFLFLFGLIQFSQPRAQRTVERIQRIQRIQRISNMHLLYSALRQYVEMNEGFFPNDLQNPLVWKILQKHHGEYNLHPLEVVLWHYYGRGRNISEPEFILIKVSPPRYQPYQCESFLTSEGFTKNRLSQP